MNGLEFLTDVNYWIGQFATIAICVAWMVFLAWRASVHMRRTTEKTLAEMEERFQQSRVELRPEMFKLPEPLPPLDLDALLGPEEPDAPPEPAPAESK